MSLSQRQDTISGIIEGTSVHKRFEDRKSATTRSLWLIRRPHHGIPLGSSWKRDLSSLDDPCDEGQCYEQERIKRMKLCHYNLIQTYCDGLKAISQVKNLNEAPDVVLPESLIMEADK
jgi:hypothetical protein